MSWSKMSCICGYKYDSEWNEKESKHNKIGDELFKEIILDYQEFYVCPKCGTLKMDLGEEQ